MNTLNTFDAATVALLSIRILFSKTIYICLKNKHNDELYFNSDKKSVM